MPRKADKKSETTRSKSQKRTTSGKASPSRKTAGAKASSGARAVVKRVVSTVVGALTRRKTGAEPAKTTAARKTEAPKAARAPRRRPDIPMDQIAATYTPTQTSLKAPFRATGADRSRDQEFATGTGDGRWNDEDRLTNKSGDPRIGTHGRTYEPGEKRAAKRKDQDE